MSCANRATSLASGLTVIAALIGCQAKEEARKQAPPRFNPQALAVEARAQDIAAGIEKYKGDIGDYPQKLEDLFTSHAKGWRGPYLGSGRPAAAGAPSHGAGDLLTDLWGTPFEYVSDAKAPKVVSFGPDKQRGTQDDIVVPVTAGRTR